MDTQNLMNTIQTSTLDLNISSSSINDSKRNENNIHKKTTKDGVLLLKCESKPNNCTKCFEFMSTLTIEPVSFLYSFVYTFYLTVNSRLIMDKGCRFYFNYSDEICGNLSAHIKEKDSVEILANNYNLYMSTLYIVAAGMMVFIVPWSEKHGRKAPLIWTCIGSILTDIGYIICVYYFESSLNYLILSRLFTEISGGYMCFATILYSHASEVTTEKNRTLKYTTLSVSYMTALAVGGLAGGYVLRYYGYFVVYSAALMIHILCIVWIVFVVEETAGPRVMDSWIVKARNMFRLDSISNSWKAIVRQRENQKKTMIWLYILAIGVNALCYEIYAGGLAYVYAHHIYNWNVAQYNAVYTGFMLSSFILMTPLSLLFLDVFKFSDPTIGIIGTASVMVKCALLAFAPYSTIFYYLGNTAGFLTGFASLAIRADVSKIIDPDENGLVFSVLSICEILIPIAGSYLFINVFNATINIIPNVVYLMSAVSNAIPLMIFVWIYYKKSKFEPYKTIINA